jgi:hypothetical protein
MIFKIVHRVSAYRIICTIFYKNSYCQMTFVRLVFVRNNQIETNGFVFISPFLECENLCYFKGRTRVTNIWKQSTQESMWT